MIRAIVVDDEYYTLMHIGELLSLTGDFDICGTYVNPLEAYTSFDETNPQVAFIDIEMPEMNGLTLAEKLLEKNSKLKIVFITAYMRYAVDAFDVNATDYILKPINKDRFSRMVQKIKESIYKGATNNKKLDINCFGDFTVESNGIPVVWQRAKAEELFAYLLMNHGRKVHKEKLIDVLWYDYSPQKALQILQTSIHRLRKIFKNNQDILQIKYYDNCYMLVLDHYEFDLKEAMMFNNQCVMGDLNTQELVEKIATKLGQGLFTNKGYLWAYEYESTLKNNFIEVVQMLHQKNHSQNEVSKYMKEIIYKIDSYDLNE